MTFIRDGNEKRLFLYKINDLIIRENRLLSVKTYTIHPVRMMIFDFLVKSCKKGKKSPDQHLSLIMFYSMNK